jgi:hypothetical protein
MKKLFLSKERNKNKGIKRGIGQAANNETKKLKSASSKKTPCRV